MKMVYTTQKFGAERKIMKRFLLLRNKSVKEKEGREVKVLQLLHFAVGDDEKGYEMEL